MGVVNSLGSGSAGRIELLGAGGVGGVRSLCVRGVAVVGSLGIRGTIFVGKTTSKNLCLIIFFNDAVEMSLHTRGTVVENSSLTAKSRMWQQS